MTHFWTNLGQPCKISDMENQKNHTSQKNIPWAPIRHLLITLGSAVALAGVFAAFMLYYYGPTGRYLLSNALLSPETITSLSFGDPEAPGARGERYAFDEIEYAHWDKSQKQWRHQRVNPSLYESFYHRIAGEKSLLEVPTEVIALFTQATPSRLTIWVKTESTKDSFLPGKPLQVVEFAAEGNYYRVELRGPEGRGGWAYFFHRGITQESLTMLSSKAG